MKLLMLTIHCGADVKHFISKTKYCIFYLKIFFTLTKSVDPDEMPHHAAIHLGLHTVCKNTHLKV